MFSCTGRTCTPGEDDGRPKETQDGPIPFVRLNHLETSGTSQFAGDAGFRSTGDSGPNVVPAFSPLSQEANLQNKQLAPASASTSHEAEYISAIYDPPSRSVSSAWALSTERDIQTMNLRMLSMETQAGSQRAMIDGLLQKVLQCQKEIHAMESKVTLIASTEQSLIPSECDETKSPSVRVLEKSVVALEHRMLLLECKADASDLRKFSAIPISPRGGDIGTCARPIEASETERKMLSLIAQHADDALSFRTSIRSLEQAATTTRDKMDQQMFELSARVLNMESSISSQQRRSPIGLSTTEHEEALQDIQSVVKKLQAQIEEAHAETLGDDHSECILKTHLVDDADDAYQLAESIWDCCGLIGQPAIGLSCSLVLFFGACLNVALQVAFCLIVFANLSSKEVEDATVEAARHWRGVVGHDITYADPIRRTSLVAQMCAEDLSVQFSSTQYQTNIDYSEFLSPDDYPEFKMLNGPRLCFMALLVWVWSIMADVLQNFRFIEAIFCQPRGVSCIVVKDGRFMIKSIGWLPCMCAIFMGTLPRFATSMFLCFVGVKFLAYTTTIGDLVLNAIALTFILGLDELVYEATAPRRVRTVISQLQPMLVENGKKKVFDRGGFIGVGIANLVTFIACLLLNFMVLQPYVDVMQKVIDELCGGDVDFVVTTHKGNAVTYWFKTEELPDPVQYSENFQKDSVLELVKDRGENNATIKMTSWPAMMRLHSSSILYASGVLKCIDHTDLTSVQAYYNNNLDMYYAPKRSLQAELGQNITSCAEVPLSACFNYNSTIVRAICAQRCGCDNPWVGNMFGTPGFGCPEPCQKLFDINLVEMSDTPLDMVSYSKMCSDPPVGLLKNLTSWQNYLVGLGEVILSTGGRMVDVVDVRFALSQNGCAIVPFIRFIDLCNPDSGGIGRSVRPWCPVACKCSITNQAECPYGCRCHLGNTTMGECGYANVANMNPETLYPMIHWWIDTKVDHHNSVMGIHHSVTSTSSTIDPNATLVTSTSFITTNP